MERIEYRTKDKSGWGNGPWQNEPDKIQWMDEATGYPCLMVRPHGSWCGYVGVPPTHPAFGKSYDDVNVSVHGGLTFASKCNEPPDRNGWEAWRRKAESRQDEAKRYPAGDAAEYLRDCAEALADYDAFVAWHEARMVCHKAEGDDVYWLGFDTSHLGDFDPKRASVMGGMSRALGYMRGVHEDVYRDQVYVQAEVENLARQLKDMAS